MTIRQKSPKAKSAYSATITLFISALMVTMQSESAYASSTDDDDYDDIPSYCDQGGPNYQGTCFDSQDFDDITGLAPCPDGSQVQKYRDCPDRESENSEYNNNGDCYESGFSDGQDQPFDQNKYYECGSTYYDGFLSGCMSVQGNDREACDLAID